MVKGTKILVIDDDPQIRKFLSTSLETFDFEVLTAEDGQLGLERVASCNPKIIILDLGLPDTDGESVLEKIRENYETPVVVLSARDEEDTIVNALDLGADDYISKPFSITELVARVRSCLRRYSINEFQEDIFYSADLKVDLNSRVVMVGESEVSLTATEFDLLKALIDNAEKIVTHRQLLKTVWGPNAVERHHYLRVYIGHLRQKIEKDSSDPKIIRTEPGVGYRLKVLSTS